MVLSDLFQCICFPCHSISVFMYQNNEEFYVGKFYDDDCWFDFEKVLDNEVLEINFDFHYVLLSDKQLHN